VRRYCQLFIVGLSLFCIQCTKYINDPYCLAPQTSNSTWTPLKRNTLISSQYCQTVVPKNFSSEKLTLAELIDIGLQNNPETKQSWFEARAAAANYAQTLSDYLPEFDITASYTRVRGNFFDVAAIIPYYLTTVDPLLNVNYTIFDFGKRKNTSENAKQALYYADYLHNQEIQNVLQMVIGDYYKYVFQKEELLAKEADLENAQASLDAARQRFDLGLAALGDVAQARSKYLQAKINVTNVKRDVETSFTELAKNIGIPSNVHFKVEELPSKTDTNICLESVHTLIEKAQNNRQDFLAAKADVKAKEAKVRLAKAEGRPTIDGYASVGSTYYSLGGQEDYNFTAQVSLNIPLFKGFFYKNGERVAKSNLEKSQASLMEKELTIIKEVSDSHFNVTTSIDNLQDAEDYLCSAQEQFNIALSNYKVGTGTILDVLSAQSSLQDARSRLADAKRDWYSSLVSLAYATGSLCINEQNLELEEMKEVYQPCSLQ
jgi:TolC family type I secretion outer membrane protein